MKALTRHSLFMLIMLAAFGCVMYFGSCKKGFHEDEYYSYYSTNFTDGWGVGDGVWVYADRYYQELVVLSGEEFQYDVVKTVQGWDVHPPMYYWVLHTVCSLWKNTFTKWQGISINIFFYMFNILLLYLTCNELDAKDSGWLSLLIAGAYAFCPAVISGVMFIRMYTMVTFCVLASLYLHIRAWNRARLLDWRFLLPMVCVVYTGALTHYYFLIFQFFLSALTCVAWLLRSRKAGQSVLYGVCVLIALGLAAATFPKAVYQLFTGYRGAEAKGSFFDLSNTWERLEVFGATFLKNVFSGVGLGVVILLCITIMLIYALRDKLWKKKEWLIMLPLLFAGYFFVTAKTALMLEDEAIRYFLPITGVLYLFVFMLCCGISWGKRPGVILSAALIGALLFGDVWGLTHDGVLFLYPEAEARVVYAEEHSAIPAVYIYQQDNSWRFLASADDLLRYKLLFFISDASAEPIEDAYINQCDELVVYVTNEYTTQEQIERIQASNPKLAEYELVSEAKFCNIYYFH